MLYDTAWRTCRQLVLNQMIGFTIDGLFGGHCSGETFEHDDHMVKVATTLGIQEQRASQATTDSHRQSSPVLGHTSPVPSQGADEVLLHPRRGQSAADDSSSRHMVRLQTATMAGPQQTVIDLTLDDIISSQEIPNQEKPISSRKSHFEDFIDKDNHVRNNGLGTIGSEEDTSDRDDRHLFESQESSISACALATRRTAFDAVLHSSSSTTWAGLLSTTDNHTHLESELGED